MTAIYQDIELLFEVGNNSGLARCRCGQLINTDLPSVCKCGAHKTYWKMIDGKVVKLENMDLAHLTNFVRMLAAKTEKYPEGVKRKQLEIAMDLFYLEIGSRETETQQMTGIMKALQKSLEGKIPVDV